MLGANNGIISLIFQYFAAKVDIPSPPQISGICGYGYGVMRTIQDYEAE